MARKVINEHRIAVAINDETKRALEEIANEEAAVISAIIRRAIVREIRRTKAIAA